MRRIGSLLTAAVSLMGVAPTVAATPTCAGPPAAFVGVVYDSAQRSDFLLDVDNFESFTGTLGSSYCLPRERVRILAFEDGYQRNGFVYPEGSEAGFKAALMETGSVVRSEPDTTVFVMLSSHGSVYTRASGACSGIGSFAALKSGGGDNGTLNDCELGATLSAAFPAGSRIVAVIDCSFCGGFSDSLTAVSGTARDDAFTGSSGIPAPGRIVITGCAVTTECFGGDEGGVTYEHLRDSLDPATCDGYTAPGFPQVQGINVPTRSLERDGRCTVSEWFFAAVASAYLARDAIAVQQQFRMKYGFASLAEDIHVA